MKEDQEQKSLFHIISFSMFSDVKGPVPVYCYPEIDMSTQVEIAMKSVSLLMGEAVYQAGLSDDLKYFGILPFPDLNYIGFTYFFLIPDEKARGKSKAATVTLVVKESENYFIYDNIHTLRILLDKVRVKLRKNHDEKSIQNTLESLRQGIANIHESAELNSNQSKLKLVFAGLDKSGKTSFLKVIKEKHTEFTSVTSGEDIKHPDSDDLLGFNALEWDFGGQQYYRESYFKNASLYLNDVDLLFFFIDVQNLNRLEESLMYLSQILHNLENFKNFPIVQIVFAKYDPDLDKSATLHHSLKSIKSTLRAIHTNWDLRFFKTSIFNQSSISNCFSNGFTRLSPNKTQFIPTLKSIVRKLQGNAAVLFTQNGLELCRVIKDEKWSEIIENVKTDMYHMFHNIEEDFSSNIHYNRLQIDGISLVFHHFNLNSHDFYLLFDSPLELKKIEKIVKHFKKRISTAIHTYLN